MNKEKRRVPKLRFPGFTEDWEQRKLDEVCNVYDGTHQTPRYTNSGVMFVSVEDIETLESNKYITEEDFKSEFKAFPEYGDILLTRIGDVGSANVILDEIKRAYYVSLALLKPKNINSLFLLALLGSSSVQSEIWRRTLHIAFPKKINKNEINKVIVKQPSIPEQEKIGKLFFSLDQTITLHQRKLEHLNLKKKALLQKLFPKNGERYSELRFPGFTDAWEQRKLGDFTNQINTFVNPEDAKLPLWSLTAEAGLIEKSDRYERDFLVKKKDQFKRIETNTLVYNPMNITIGSIDIYTGLYPIAVSGYYVSIVYDKNIDTDFLKEALLLPSSLKMYKNYATGSLIERQRVQYPTFSKLQLLFPNLDEQKAIGQLFKSLNLNITLHQRKLEHLQLQKKALLQQMFV